MSSFQLTVLLVILIVTAVSGIYPFVKKANNPRVMSLRDGLKKMSKSD